MITQLRNINFNNKKEYIVSVSTYPQDGSWKFSDSFNDGVNSGLVRGYTNKVSLATIQGISSIGNLRTLRCVLDYGQDSVVKSPTPNNIWWIPPKLFVKTSDNRCIKIASNVYSTSGGATDTTYTVSGDTVDLSVPIFNDFSSDIELFASFPTNYPDGENQFENVFTGGSNMSLFKLSLQLLTYTERPYWFQRNPQQLIVEHT